MAEFWIAILITMFIIVVITITLMVYYYYETITKIWELEGQPLSLLPHRNHGL